MYRLSSSASCFSYRVFTGTWRRHAPRCPSSRRGRAVPEAASGGTGAKSVARHREVPNFVPTRPPTKEQREQAALQKMVNNEQALAS